MARETIVIGAGLAGLACARSLAAAGAPVRILERSKGVGGRCATRRIEGQPVDHGLPFLHGADPAFQRALESVAGAAPIEGWPERIEGSGSPCQPEAFAQGQKRVAFREGVNAFAKEQARGLDIARNTRLLSIEAERGGFAIRADTEAPIHAACVVLAVPLEAARDLVEQAGGEKSFPTATELLRAAGTTSCLTVIAGYPVEAPAPEWDVFLPLGGAVQTVLHDSSKRPTPGFRILVLQSRAEWARRQLREPEDQWAAEMLRDAAGSIGAWAATPAWTQTHVWRYARTEEGSRYVQPVLESVPGGGALGLAGEAFAPCGGAEGAWLSGERLASRFLERRD